MSEVATWRGAAGGRGEMCPTLLTALGAVRVVVRTLDGDELDVRAETPRAPVLMSGVDVRTDRTELDAEGVEVRTEELRGLL